MKDTREDIRRHSCSQGASSFPGKAGYDLKQWPNQILDSLCVWDCPCDKNGKYPGEDQRDWGQDPM